MSKTITGGLVSVEDGIKSPIEFAPARKVRVELTFDLEKLSEEVNAESALDRVSNLVNNQVRKLLHQAPELIQQRADAALKAAEPPVPVNDPADLPITPTPDAGENEQFEARLAAKRTRRTKAEMEAARAAEAAAKADPSDLPPAEATAEIIIVPDAADLIGELPAETTITDASLHDAITQRNGVINNPTAIRELIASYRSDPTKPWSASMIPQGSRTAFLDRLKELK